MRGREGGREEGREGGREEGGGGNMCTRSSTCTSIVQYILTCSCTQNSSPSLSPPPHPSPGANQRSYSSSYTSSQRHATVTSQSGRYGDGEAGARSKSPSERSSNFGRAGTVKKNLNRYCTCGEERERERE